MMVAKAEGNTTIIKITAVVIALKIFIFPLNKLVFSLLQERTLNIADPIRSCQGNNTVAGNREKPAGCLRTYGIIVSNRNNAKVIRFYTR